MTTIELTEWRASPHFPYTPLLGKSIETGSAIRGIFDPIPVRVPGSLYETLAERGILEDVRVGMNSLKAEWVKDRWWLYETEFELEETEDAALCFEGVDYRCHVYLNGVRLGEHTGALTPFRFDASDAAVRGRNALRVLVESAPEDMGQIGRTDLTHTQRPRFDYKWDFCTRLVNVGIYRPVRVEQRGGAELGEYHFRTLGSPEQGRGALSAAIRVRRDFRGSYAASLWKDGTECCRSTVALAAGAGSTSVSVELHVPGAEVWFPNGMGRPATYRLVQELRDGTGALSDRREHCVGFRSIAFERNEGAPAGALPYTCVVNGRRVWLRGFNVTPLDQLLGTETRARYETLIRSAAEAHANILRVWGGGIVEQELFYELCSEYGLMVWQDMVQSSSGISNVPSKRPEFLKLLAESARHTAVTRRNDPCLAVLCGGNELFGEDGRPVTEEDANVAMLAEIFRRECPECAFLPSTSSGPVQEADLDRPEHNHDVHGPWLFLGEEKHFRYFNRLSCLFSAEFGCNGMAGLGQLEHILPVGSREVTTMQEDIVWRHHGDWWDVQEYVNGVFGPQRDLAQYILLSQFIQAVGLGYAASSHRRNAWHQSGCMIWQLNEMFPNVSCTTLIEYYGARKPAYYAAKRAFAPLAVSFRFDALTYRSEARISAELFVSDDGEAGPVELEWTCEADGKTFASDRLRLESPGGGRSIACGSIEVPPGTARRSVLVRVRASGGGRSARNELLLLVRDEAGHCDASEVPGFIRDLALE